MPSTNAFAVERLDLTPSISCVMPAFNEAKSLSSYASLVIQTLSSLSTRIELIIINDGSLDNTNQVLSALCTQHPEIVAIELSRNFGKEAALTAGLDAAKGDIIFIMDADGQHPLNLLAEMLSKWRLGADVVYAIRKTRHDQTWLYATFTHLFYKLINWKSRVKIPPNAGDFRLIDRQVLKALQTLTERNRFMKGLYAWVGFNCTSIDYEPLARLHGVTNYGFSGALSLAVTGILSFTTKPLRLVSYFGGILSLAALAYGTYLIVGYFMYGTDTPGFATIMVGLMFFSGVQMLSIGVLAEYVGRIYDEVKNRPTYLTRSKIGIGLDQSTLS